MTDEELDRAYTALCDAMAEAGEDQAQRFLAMLCLALMARLDRPDEVHALVEQVKAHLAAHRGR